MSSGTTDYLYGVSFTDANTGTASGLRRHHFADNIWGTTWAAQNSGTTETRSRRVVHRCDHRDGRGRGRDHRADDGRGDHVGGAK